MAFRVTVIVIILDNMRGQIWIIFKAGLNTQKTFDLLRGDLIKPILYLLQIEIPLYDPMLDIRGVQNNDYQRTFFTNTVGKCVEFFFIPNIFCFFNDSYIDVGYGF